MNNKPRMTKDIVPDDFTLSLALVDALPVLLFGVNCIIIGSLFSSPLFILGAALCVLGGAGKVLWKIIVVIKKRNVWFLFVQMRILMPIGFLMMVAALIARHSELSLAAIWAGLTSMPAGIFFALGVLGMILMSLFAVKLNNSDLKANWIEQLTNGASQLAFLIGLLLI